MQLQAPRTGPLLPILPAAPVTSATRPRSAGRPTPKRRPLGLPVGELGGRHAGGDGGGAALSHERTGDGVRGAAHPARPLLGQRRGTLGVRRGAQRPLARSQCSTLRGLAYAP